MLLTQKDLKMANAIYKAGVPAVTAVPTYGTYGAAGTSAVSAVTGAANTTNAAVSPVTGVAVGVGKVLKNGQYATVGVSMAGSLNANGVLTVAPGRNSPQS
jgi:hypothetical protein